MLKPKYLSCGFAAGAVGSLVLLFLIFGLHKLGKGPEVTTALIYKDIVWGGLWGLLLVLPVLSNRWWLRGIILGVLAGVVLMIFFMPGGQAANIIQIIVIFIVHIVWGLTAALWYKLTS